MRRTYNQVGVLLLFFAAFMASQLLGAGRSSDLLATWIAGQMFATGQMSEIYMSNEAVFTMTPPDSWAGFVTDQTNYTGALFPFLYPPLWAWASSLLADVPFASFARFTLFLNVGLISGCVFLGFRITRAPVNLLLFSLITLPILYLTPIGTVAIFEGQPQVLVCFLLLLMLERLRAGDQFTAGAVLGLAAAIKVYPALFALFLWPAGDRRALFSFVVVGGALGLLSIATTGWPLHLEFLANAKRAADSALVADINYNLHGSLAQMLAADDLIKVILTTAASQDETIFHWHVLAKSSVWQTLSGLAVLTTLAAGWILMRKLPEEQRFESVWPALFTLIPLLSPLGWAYYYIAPIALVPILFKRLPFPVALFGIISILVMTVFPMQPVFRELIAGTTPYQLVGTAAMVLLTILFLAQLRSKATK